MPGQKKQAPNTLTDPQKLQFFYDNN